MTLDGFHTLILSPHFFHKGNASHISVYEDQILQKLFFLHVPITTAMLISY